MKRFALCAFAAILSLLSAAAQTKQRWMDEPVRMILVLLGENRSSINPDKLVQGLVDMNANTLLLPTGGIAAHYPTQVEFHYRSPSLPPGRDLVGEVVQKAHARGIRVMSRFEWSMIQSKEACEAHPDWFQRQANGKPNYWNGCYLTCINGGYQQEHIFKILGEVLDKYPIDGVFTNVFGQRMNDNDGKKYAPCACDNCKRLFRAKYNRDIPAEPDADYRKFIAEAGQSLGIRVGKFSHSKRPGLNFMLGRGRVDVQYIDSFNSEIHSASVIGQRSYWLYASSRLSTARAPRFRTTCRSTMTRPSSIASGVSRTGPRRMARSAPIRTWPTGRDHIFLSTETSTSTMRTD